MMRIRRFCLLASSLVCVLFPLVQAQESGPKPPADFSPIQHFVFIVKENRSFDSMFGTFPGANGAVTGLLSTGQVIPLGRMPDALPRDFGHSWGNTLSAVDHGKMDGFDTIIDAG